MKFKLVEDINRGHEDVPSNELLDENILLEFTGTGLKDNVSTFIRQNIKSYISGKNIEIKKERGQTELKIYLCVNNDINPSNKICVHHIDFNHSNYHKDNICLLYNEDHNYLHKNLMTECINIWLNKQDFKHKNHRKKLNVDKIDDEVISYISDIYIDFMKEFLSSKRLDRNFP